MNSELQFYYPFKCGATNQNAAFSKNKFTTQIKHMVRVAYSSFLLMQV